jgi:hypothetical protein
MPDTNQDSRSTPARRAKEELRRRAAHYLEQPYLVVDYYRIRRKLAYPLPIKSLSLPTVPVPGISEYPWATWMTWALEERVNCLGWVGEWFGDEACRKAAATDLRHLAQWPQYRQYPAPDLSLGHTARILANSLRQWEWLSAEACAAIKSALQRLVTDAAPLVEKYFDGYPNTESIVAAPDPHLIVRNIPLIGALGVALAANALDAPEKSTLDGYIKNAVSALFALREGGLSEGVSYDGYVLDFIMDWLAFRPAEERSAVLEHPQFARYFDESLWLSTPGDAAQVVEIGDVESEQMPFHISAQAKANVLKPLPERSWYLQQCCPETLRADALAALQALAENAASTPPSAHAIHAQYAAALRSGWESDDVAVIIAASNSPMGHIHGNNGSLAIGTRGAWFIQTPGYQQYLPNSERDFTLGAASRNTPLLNELAPVHKAMQILRLETSGATQTAELDLTPCYPEELTLQAVRRRVRLIEKQLVVVEDTINGDSVQNIAYYWHGHPDAAWWIEDNWACLRLGGSTLWFGSPQMEISENNLQRLRGSRGQLTLATHTRFAGTAAALVHWYFLFGEIHPQNNELFRLYKRT